MFLFYALISCATSSQNKGLYVQTNANDKSADKSHAFSLHFIHFIFSVYNDKLLKRLDRREKN